MDKGKKSLLNALAALIQMIVTSVIGLLFNKVLISTFGSDYNGVNSTVSQIISTLLILEGGLSLASNVALFNPFGKKEYLQVNGILNATKKRFHTIGLLAFLIGLIVTFIYPFTVNSIMPKWMIMALMMSALIPVCFNLAFSMKYRVLILTDQKEYIISFLTALTYIIGTGLAILLIKFGFSILVARLAIMFFLLVNYSLIAIYCKLKYRFLDFTTIPNHEAIKGTKNVMILKLTSVVYYSAPIIVISTIPSIGPLLASVYAVYKSILAVVKDSLSAVSNAPRLAFGALLSERGSKDTEPLFNQFEMLTCIGVSVIVGTTSLLILPFIGLYTNGITDIEYKDIFLAVILILTVVMEILHIPSGQIIQMKGEFSSARKIQSIALVVLIVSMVIGRLFYGFYGIVTSVLIAAFTLGIMEIYYVNAKVFQRHISKVLKNMLPCLAICIVSLMIGLKDIIIIQSYVSFALFGVLLVIILGTITLSVYYFIDRKSVISLYSIIIKALKIRKASAHK